MKNVYLSMSTDIIHNGHINIISQAARLGEVTVGVLTDKAVATYKRYPLVSFEDRCRIVGQIKGVSHVVRQDSIDYEENLLLYKPDIVVHGDDWRTGFQSHIREKVISLLASYGGELVEFSYTKNAATDALEAKSRHILSMPEHRRCRLKELLSMKKMIRILEAHNGITGLIVEHTEMEINGESRQFDGMWISSLCDSAAKGKPDIELVDNSSRLKTIDEIMEVTTKPIILDGDTGGMVEHFQFLVKTLERMGVSAVIIEDKAGLKKNSLFGTEANQTQIDIVEMQEKLEAGKAVLTTPDFLIIARIESLILGKGIEDALKRAAAYVKAGADGILIHSCQKSPSEIFEFCDRFRETDVVTPLIVVPTTYNSVKEDELEAHGVNIVIYANHLIRSAFPAMQNTARSILKNSRCMEADQEIMPIRDIITLIPEA